MRMLFHDRSPDQWHANAVRTKRPSRISPTNAPAPESPGGAPSRRGRASQRIRSERDSRDARANLALLRLCALLPPMSTKVLEQKVTELAKRVEKLEKRAGARRKGGWEAIAGKAKDDDLFDEAMKLGTEWRARANVEGQ